MEQTIKVYCKNNGKTIEVPMGATLEDVFNQSGIEMTHGPISAHVNNKVEGMHFRIYKQKEVSFSTSPRPAVPVPTPAVFFSCSAKPPTSYMIPARWPSTFPSAMATMSISTSDVL